MKFVPHQYQENAYNHIMVNPAAGLLLDMGLGKTVVTLTAIKELVYGMEILKPLIIAPKLVAEQTWSGEIKKWDHLKKLKLSRIIGTPKQRIAALSAPADVYIVSVDNIDWLVQYYGPVKFPYDMLVIDEWSMFKSKSSQRFKAVKKIRGKIDRFIGLTGTPVSNGLLDIWAPMYLLDGGKRLGKTITSYRGTYFKPGRRNGHVVFNYNLKDGAKEIIYAKISDVCLSMKAEDWLDLPPKHDVIQEIELPEMARYLEFKKTQILKIEDQGIDPDEWDLFDDEDLDPDKCIVPANAAGMYNKLLQFSNGAVYDDKGNYHVVSNAKLDALVELVQEANGRPVIVFYQFRSDVERIKARIPNVANLKNPGNIELWNAGKIPVLLLHPKSTAHGLNLQEGGNYMIWFGLPWSLELYLQAVARLFRQGQLFKLINLHLIAKGTVEEIVYQRLLEKDYDQQELLNALR